jgi:hypothetical protein
MRSASLLTLAFTFIALWIAFVTTGGEPPGPEQPLQWTSALLMTLFLMGALFLAGLLATSDQKSRRSLSYRRESVGTWTMIAALIAVGALLGLVYALRVVLWGGPAWLRWAIAALVTVTILAVSGRALGCAALLGLIWGLLGVWAGAGQEPVARVDLILTGSMVGATVGAVAGTLWKAGRRRGHGGL